MSKDPTVGELYAALLANTAAQVALTEITTKLHNLRADAIEQVTKAAKPGAQTTKKTDAAPTAETPAAAAPADKAEPNEVQKAVAAYVGGSEREAEREARMAKVRELLANPKVNVAKVSDVPESLFPAMLKALKTLTDKGDLTTVEAPAEADPDDLGV